MQTASMKTKTYLLCSCMSARDFMHKTMSYAIETYMLITSSPLPFVVLHAQ